jgi:hypothetical protein
VGIAKALARVVQDLLSEEFTKKRSKDDKIPGRWKVGLASIASGVVMRTTGGLPTPLVTAGRGTVLGRTGLGGTAAASLLGVIAESGAAVEALFGINGARVTGKRMDQYTKDIKDFAFLPLRGAHPDEYRDGNDVSLENRRLRVVLGVSGWLSQSQDVTNPWRTLGHQGEVYALRWEVNVLRKMGTSLETVVRSAAWSTARKEIIARTSEAPPGPSHLYDALTCYGWSLCKSS